MYDNILVGWCNNNAQTDSYIQNKYNDPNNIQRCNGLSKHFIYFNVIFD